MLKIRLRQQGRKNHIVYRLVLTDVKAPRNGKYLEALGWYNPHEDQEEQNLNIKADRILFWLKQGAELTEKASYLVRKGSPEVLKEYVEAKKAKREKIRIKKKAYRKRLREAREAATK